MSSKLFVYEVTLRDNTTQQVRANHFHVSDQGIMFYDCANPGGTITPVAYFPRADVSCVTRVEEPTNAED